MSDNPTIQGGCERIARDLIEAGTIRNGDYTTCIIKALGFIGCMLGEIAMRMPEVCRDK